MSDSPSKGTSPFHRGEQDVQARLGVRDIEDWARKVVRDYLPEEHRAFHTALPFVVAGARDAEGQVWATLLTGPEGFVSSPDSRRLVMDCQQMPGDGLEGALRPGADIGLLGIELASRRRNRVNGQIAGDVGGAYTFVVGQSFGNCPQYIHERDWIRVTGEAPGPARNSEALNDQHRDWITAADTFFIASGYRGEGESPAYGMDVSHRGGEPGFVEVVNDRRLRFPDYAGNNHFNTIGNLMLDPRAGFLFVDFETGGLLQLTGKVTIDWDSDDVRRFPGARRLVEFEIGQIIELPRAVPLRWTTSAEPVRSLRLIKKIPESDDVTSFVFEARDAGPLPPYEAGQHLPIELEIPGHEQPVRRTYSLSGPPSRARYRISVKREPGGLVSRHLHDRVEVGATLESRKPAGDFMMSCSTCPVVFVSAGVGVTPMVAMLHAVATEGGDRPILFVHGARNGRHHPLAREVRAIAEKRTNIRLHVAYSRPEADDRRGEDFDSEGRVDGELLAGLVNDGEAHYFLCGPTAFMADVQSGLERHGVPPEQIHSETFGPKG